MTDIWAMLERVGRGVGDGRLWCLSGCVCMSGWILCVGRYDCGPGGLTDLQEGKGKEGKEGGYGFLRDVVW